MISWFDLAFFEFLRFQVKSFWVIYGFLMRGFLEEKKKMGIFPSNRGYFHDFLETMIVSAFYGSSSGGIFCSALFPRNPKVLFSIEYQCNWVLKSNCSYRSEKQLKHQKQQWNLGMLSSYYMAWNQPSPQPSLNKARGMSLEKCFSRRTDKINK